jgi:Tol biopolymer transport system component
MKKWIIFLFLFQSTLLQAREKSLVPELTGSLVFGTWVWDLDTNTRQYLRPFYRGGSVEDAVLAPNNEAIVFNYQLTSKQETSQFELRILDFFSGERVLLKSKKPFLFDWSPDSLFLVVHRFENPNRFIVIDVHQNDYWIVMTATATIRNFNSIRWGKNGSNLLFVANLNSGNTACFKMGLNGKFLLPTVLLPPSQVSIAPNEDWIAYVPAHQTDIFVMNLQSEEKHQLFTTPEKEQFPFWCPNGEWIGFQRLSEVRDGKISFLLRHINTGVEKELNTDLPRGKPQWWGSALDSVPNCKLFVDRMMGLPRKLPNP